MKRGETVNYRAYKLKQFLSNLFDNSIKLVFFIPRRLYATSDEFKKFIDGNESKSYIKKRNNRLAKNIFYKLEQNGDCTVYAGYDFNNDFPVDRSDPYYGELLRSEKWINKNKLIVSNMTPRQYMDEFYKDKRHWISNSNLDGIVYIVKRK